MKRNSMAFLLGLAACRLALCWGPDGHKIAAAIAEKHLESSAAVAVHRILGPDSGLADIANIADQVRNEQTAPWHFVDIPLRDTALDRAKVCPDGKCVVAAIERFRDELKKPGGTPEIRRVALYNVVHFVGDLHQPLHCADNDDRGGNEVKVLFENHKSNLHRVWDSGIIEQEDPDFESFAEELDAAITSDEIAAWSGGTPESWALESHKLARDVAYKFRAPASGPVVLSRRYLRRSAPVIDQQLSRAGIRLAFVLNQILP